MTAEGKLAVWVPDVPERRRLEDLPIRMMAVPNAGPDALPTPHPVPVDEVEVLVLPDWPQEVLEAVLPRMPRLRLVQTLSAGVDRVVPSIPEGVTLCDAAGVHDTPVAEWVAAAVLAAQKELPRFLDAQREARWAKDESLARDLEGSHVLILGAGSIGRAVEARLAPFGVTFDRLARRAREGVQALDALPELLPRADILVVLVPLTDETRHLVDAEVLAALPDDALVVNAARGAVVDGDALLAELRRGRLRAALDTLDPEPLPDGHPLWSAPGALITPHVAGASPHVFDRALDLARDQIERLLAGEPLRNVVQDGY